MRMLPLLRLVLLLAYHALRGGVWVVEQPATTLMWRHPRFQWLLDTVPVRSGTKANLL